MPSRNALILDGSQSGDYAIEQARGITIHRLADAGCETTVLTLRTMMFNGCAACPEGDCEEKDNCVSHDDGSRIREVYVASDLIVILTPLRTGVYSFSIKNAIDRLLPIYASIVQHKGTRYRLAKADIASPSLFAVGVAEADDEDCVRLFRTVVERTARALHAPHCNALPLKRGATQEIWDRFITDGINDVCSRLTR